LFDQVITQCMSNISLMNCCHDDGRDCYCYNCLQPGFYVGGLDEYECDKKSNFYVLKYGPSYISEIYHYLSVSKILETFEGSTINILSLGCGFSPDYYAITKYISDNNLPLNFQYYGWDISSNWDSTRISCLNVLYSVVDLLNPFSIENCYIIMLNKIFSTIHRHGNHSIFLTNLIDAIKNTMTQGAFLLFNDVNHRDNGRDIFDDTISPLFTPVNVRRYFIDDPNEPVFPGNGSWIKIRQNGLIYPINYSSNINPISNIRHNVFFEYRK